MTDPIHINCDFDTLVSQSFTAWRGNASYKVDVEINLPSYTKFIVKYFPLGVVGTLEIMKREAEYIASFSDVILVENYDELVEEAKQEAAQDASGYEENDIYAANSILLKKLDGKLRTDMDPKLCDAKERKWRETIYEYKRIIKPLQAADEPQKPEKPQKPKDNGSFDVWFDWYHSMLNNDFKCTLEEIALETHHSPGYIRQLHAQYVIARGISGTKKTTNKKANKN